MTLGPDTWVGSDLTGNSGRLGDSGVEKVLLGESGGGGRLLPESLTAWPRLEELEERSRSGGESGGAGRFGVERLLKEQLGMTTGAGFESLPHLEDLCRSSLGDRCLVVRS